MSEVSVDIELLHDLQGMLPLHWSCLCGHLGVTNRLISKNMINTTDGFGRTPSMLAASSGNLQSLKVCMYYKNMYLCASSTISLITSFIAHTLVQFRAILYALYRCLLQWFRNRKKIFKLISKMTGGSNHESNFLIQKWTLNFVFEFC